MWPPPAGSLLIGLYLQSDHLQYMQEYAKWQDHSQHSVQQASTKNIKSSFNEWSEHST